MSGCAAGWRRGWRGRPSTSWSSWAEPDAGGGERHERGLVRGAVCGRRDWPKPCRSPRKPTFDSARRTASRRWTPSFDEPVRTDYDLNPDWRAPPERRLSARAAVLVGLIDRGDDFGVLLTLRPDTMASHAGQVAFPGGRIEPGETRRCRRRCARRMRRSASIPATVNVLGQGDTYLTGTRLRDLALRRCPAGRISSRFPMRAKSPTCSRRR